MSEDKTDTLDFLQVSENDLPTLAIAVAAPLLGSIFEVWIWWSLLRIPEGTAIRPMWQSMQALVVDLAALAYGGASSLKLAATHGKKAAGWILGILSFAPILVGILFVRWALTSRHLTMAP